MTAGSKPVSVAGLVAMASMVAGLLGLVVAGIPLGIVAIACGIVAVTWGKRSGVAGIALGAVDLVMALLLGVAAGRIVDISSCRRVLSDHDTG